MVTSLTRRAVIGTVGSLAGTALGLSDVHAQTAAPEIKLRLLETSDLHMFVLDWDYFGAKVDPTVGVTKIATLIRKARAEAPNTLLFDNGDFLQGSALGDYVAQAPRPTATAPHPIVTVFSSLGYDAVGLGNHEFNFGLDFLEASLAGAPFPFVCANVTRVGGGEFLAPTAVLERRAKDSAGAEHTLRIGVIGFVPPQIMIWDKSRLTGKIETTDIVLAAKRHLPALREGADVVVALCHSGIRSGEWAEGQENSAFQLAAVPGIDVLMTGHSHRVFPGKDYANVAGVDAVAGRVQGVPTVMPGFWGSHLGVVDLTLARDTNANRWRVAQANVETRPIYRRNQGKVEELTTADPAITTAVAAPHVETIAWVEQPVGAIDEAVDSYFVWTGDDPASALVNAAQTWYARQLLAGTPYASLPLLASVAPFRAGYTPDSFIDIKPGATSLRDVAGLYLYSNNTVTAVKVTGAQILEWLEVSARAFNLIEPAAAGSQALVDKRVPSYNFDCISGITYKIDVTKPARYDNRGKLINLAARRVVDLAFEGKSVDPTREFIVVSNNYRADGGGSFPGLDGSTIVLRAPDSNRDAIVQYFRANKTVTVPTGNPWSFALIGRPTAVYFDTGKSARPRLADKSGLTSLGDVEPGYLRVGLMLA